MREPVTTPSILGDFFSLQSAYASELFNPKMNFNMTPIRLVDGGDETKTPEDAAVVLLGATDQQVDSSKIEDPDKLEDFQLSTDALNFHRLIWRFREEWGVEKWESEAKSIEERIKARICRNREYDPAELNAALIATKERARLPFGWTAIELASKRNDRQPVRLLNPELELSRYAKGIVGLAIQLQAVQGDEPILLPVDMVREILKAKKVVVAGTLTQLVEVGLLEMTKSEYHTGSAREYKFLGKEGVDYVFERPSKPIV